MLTIIEQNEAMIATPTLGNQLGEMGYSSFGNGVNEMLMIQKYVSETPIKLTE